MRHAQERNGHYVRAIAREAVDLPLPMSHDTLKALTWDRVSFAVHRSQTGGAGPPLDVQPGAAAQRTAAQLDHAEERPGAHRGPASCP